MTKTVRKISFWVLVWLALMAIGWAVVTLTAPKAHADEKASVGFVYCWVVNDQLYMIGQVNTSAWIYRLQSYATIKDADGKVLVDKQRLYTIQNERFPQINDNFTSFYLKNEGVNHSIYLKGGTCTIDVVTRAVWADSQNTVADSKSFALPTHKSSPWP